jgi:thiamine-phosphate pyrophosphorylase
MSQTPATGGSCMTNFLLAVLSLPGVFPGEADYMEALLSAGVERLHLRKPEATPEELEELLQRLAPRGAERLVLHGPRSRELALRYGVPNVHGAVAYRDGLGYSGGGPMVDAGGLALSTSAHGWEEFDKLPAGLAYAFISPLFDSISKRGYGANARLLQRPKRELPCLPVGLGGVSGDTIGSMLEHGWKGAAVLGWIWEEPKQAVKRLEELQKIIANGK